MGKVRKSQTATEYLIILAVVIIIALVVVNTLGGFPGIGASNSKKVSDLKLSTDTIGIESYNIGTNSSIFKIKNNYYDTATVTEFRINKNDNLTCNSSNTVPALPVVLNIGQSMIINCSAVNGSTYTLSSKQIPMIGITYIDNMGVIRTAGNEGSSVAVSQGQVSPPSILYTITFNSNTGTGSMSTQTIQQDTSANLIPNNFTRTNYTFSGWNTLANGGGLNYLDNSSYTMGSSNVTLYAQWTVIPYVCTNALPFENGSGTSGNPYGICSWTQLNNVRNVLNGYYELLANLDSGSTGYATYGAAWTPIGDYNTRFAGNFNGNGYTITGLTVTGSNNYVGLFGCSTGTISNVGLISVNISGGNKVGGLVGSQMSGTITSSYSTGSVSAGNYVGGLVGDQYGDGASITSSYSTTSVSGGSWVGGLVGIQAPYASITSSYSTGSVSGSSDVGGLLGYQIRYTQQIGTGSTSSSYWDTTTSGQTTSASGIGTSIAEMKKLYMYSTIGAWSITGGQQDLNNGYPYLSATGSPTTWLIPDNTSTFFSYIDYYYIGASVPTTPAEWKNLTGYAGVHDDLFSSIDGSNYNFSATVGGNYEATAYRIFVATGATGVTFSWTGYDTLTSGGSGVNIEAYNYTSSSWDNIASTTSSTIQNFSYTFSSLSNYVDSGEMWIRVVGRGIVALSCPYLYLWDGTKYNFVGDMNGYGIMALPDYTATGANGFFDSHWQDWWVISDKTWLPKDGKYTLEYAQDPDEAGFTDYMEMWTMDHPAGITVYSPYTGFKGMPLDRLDYLSPNNDGWRIYTIRNETLPVSATATHGGVVYDVLDKLSAVDGIFVNGEYYKDITIDLGDLTGAPMIKLITNAKTTFDNTKSFDPSAPVANYIYIMKNGVWTKQDFLIPRGFAKMNTFDMTRMFEGADNYKFKLEMGYGSVDIDYLAFDISPDESNLVTINKYPVTSAVLSENPADRTALWEGNTTKTGDVLPLLTASDDRFVIHTRGDSIQVGFNMPPAVEDGLVRDLVFYSEEVWKNSFGMSKLNGSNAIEPYPYQDMPSYPYNVSAYPYNNSEEYKDYINEWNTRMIYPTGAVHHTMYVDYVNINITN